MFSADCKIMAAYNFSNVILSKDLVKMAGSKRMEYVFEYLEIIHMSPGTKLVNAAYNRGET